MHFKYHDTFLMSISLCVLVSPPLHRSRRSECLVCVVHCPDRRAEGRTDIWSGSTTSDNDGLWPEERFQALPERKKRELDL